MSDLESVYAFLKTKLEEIPNIGKVITHQPLYVEWIQIEQNLTFTHPILGLVLRAWFLSMGPGTRDERKSIGAGGFNEDVEIVRILGIHGLKEVLGPTPTNTEKEMRALVRLVKAKLRPVVRTDDANIIVDVPVRIVRNEPAQFSGALVWVAELEIGVRARESR